ncbi:MAG: phenylacetate--CoA ligase family protein [Nitrososphaerota archaeon]|nr:phenylacetate--CoA ligase family protein [Nitrososphaerota archaeon]MDG6990738.1 phenylacetate--CoA ligase family protein [Nitrososphaerota archaeon]
MLPRGFYHYLRAKRTYRLGKNDLLDLQAKRLRAAVRYSYNTVPYYHRLMKGGKLGPDAIRSPNDLGRMPDLDKPKILAAGAALRSLQTRPALSRKTSGTTGQRVEFFMDANFIDIGWGLGFRRNWMAGIPFLARGAQMVLADTDRWTYFGNRSNYPFKTIVGTVDSEMMLLRTVLVTRGVRSFRLAARELSRTKLDVLKGKASVLVAVGRAMEEEGLEFSVDRVAAGAEALFPAAKKEIESRYNAMVTANYGSAEVGAIGGECSAQTGIHVFTDYHLMEVLKGEEPASPGEEGEVVITTMLNRAMPLIRYRTGDYATLADEEKCECGSYLPRLKFVSGRKQDFLVRKGGTTLSPHFVVEFFDGLLGPINYQLAQQGDDRFILRSQVKVDGPALLAMHRFLEGAVGGAVAIEVEEWEGLKVGAKYRPFLAQAPASRSVAA